MSTQRKIALAAGILTLAITGAFAQEASPVVGDTTPMPDDVATSTIKDPVLHRIEAIDVHYPQGWHFAGTMDLDGAGGFLSLHECGPGQVGVFRATSPDGLSFVEQMPTFPWKWETGPKAQSHQKDVCFHLDPATDAKKFVATLAQVLGVEYVADAPIPVEMRGRAEAAIKFVNANAKKAYQGQSRRPPETTGDSARAVVQFKNGTYAMKGQLTAHIGCWSMERMQFPRLGQTPKQRMEERAEEPTLLHTCTAFAIFLVAPENQFSDLVAKWDKPLPDLDANKLTVDGLGNLPLGAVGMGARPKSSWMAAKQAKLVDDMKHLGADSFIRNEAQLVWRVPLQLSMSVRDQMVKDWETRRRPVEIPAREPEKSLQAGPLSPDWVDEMLGSYEEDDKDDTRITLKPIDQILWSDQDGQNRFQTHDPEANPNGILPGVWTKTSPAQ